MRSWSPASPESTTGPTVIRPAVHGPLGAGISRSSSKRRQGAHDLAGRACPRRRDPRILFRGLRHLQVRGIRTPIFRTRFTNTRSAPPGRCLEGVYIRILGGVGSHRTRLRSGAPAEDVTLARSLIPRQVRDKRGVSNGSRERRASVDPAAPPVPARRGAAGPLSTRKRLGERPLPIPFRGAGFRGRGNSRAPSGRPGRTIRTDRPDPPRTGVRLRKQTDVARDIERAHGQPRGHLRQRRRLSPDRIRRRLGWGTSCDMRSWDLSEWWKRKRN